MSVTVTFTYEPDEGEADENDRTGLTSEAFDKLMDDLMPLGAENVQVAKS